MQKIKYIPFSLILILLLGLVLRTAWHSEFPPGLNWDEASIGYNAYSLFLTGRDEWGESLPAIFRAFGDYKLPGYVYMAVPPVSLLGLTPFSTRLPSVAAGWLLILVTYLLSRRIFGRTTALWSALLVAVSPWTLFLSRISVEANLAALFISLGICLGFYRRYLLAAVFLGLSVWTYNSARIFVPLLVLSLTPFYLSRWRRVFPAVITLLIFLVPMFIQSLTTSGQARFRNISLLDPGAVAGIEAARNNSTLPDPWPRLLHNRVAYLGKNFTFNYLKHYLPDFLFINGGSHYQFNIPRTGLIFWIALPFFYLGLILVFRMPARIRNIFLIWLLAAPVAGSLTRDAPHTLRAIPLLPLPMIIAAGGLNFLSARFRRVGPYASWGFLLAVILFLESYLTGLAPAYRVKYSSSWQYGHDRLAEFLESNSDRYNRIIITKEHGEPHIFVAFYGLWPPEEFQSDDIKSWDYHDGWYWVNRLGQIDFVVDRELADFVAGLPQGRNLVISGPKYPYLRGKIDTINYLDGTPAFYLSEI